LFYSDFVVLRRHGYPHTTHHVRSPGVCDATPCRKPIKASVTGSTWALSGPAVCGPSQKKRRRSTLAPLAPSSWSRAACDDRRTTGLSSGATGSPSPQRRTPPRNRAPTTPRSSSMLYRSPVRSSAKRIAVRAERRRVRADVVMSDRHPRPDCEVAARSEASRSAD
jgi:hypothetical protein